MRRKILQGTVAGGALAAIPAGLRTLSKVGPTAAKVAATSTVAPATAKTFVKVFGAQNLQELDLVGRNLAYSGEDYFVSSSGRRSLPATKALSKAITDNPAMDESQSLRLFMDDDFNLTPLHQKVVEEAERGGWGAKTLERDLSDELTLLDTKVLSRTGKDHFKKYGLKPDEIGQTHDEMWDAGGEHTKVFDVKNKKIVNTNPEIEKMVEQYSKDTRTRTALGDPFHPNKLHKDRLKEWLEYAEADFTPKEIKAEIADRQARLNSAVKGMENFEKTYVELDQGFWALTKIIEQGGKKIGTGVQKISVDPKTVMSIKNIEYWDWDGIPIATGYYDDGYHSTSMVVLPNEKGFSKLMGRDFTGAEVEDLIKGFMPE